MRFIVVHFLLTVLASTSVGTQALSYPSPPKFYVEGSKAENLFIRINTQEEVVEVLTADTFEHKWSAEVRRYQPYGSIIELSRDGEYLYHVIQNESVHSINSVCVEVFSPDGLVREYRIKDFSQSLRVNESKESYGGAPSHLWRTERRMVWLDGITVELYGGGYAIFHSKTREIEVYDTPYPHLR